MKNATIPQRNQRLYKCWNGEIVTTKATIARLKDMVARSSV